MTGQGKEADKGTDIYTAYNYLRGVLLWQSVQYVTRKLGFLVSR